jgi:hypothetical protein
MGKNIMNSFSLEAGDRFDKLFGKDIRNLQSGYQLKSIHMMFYLSVPKYTFLFSSFCF